MKRALLIGLLALLVLGSASAAARPATCVAVVDGPALDYAVRELVRYSSDIQAGVVADQTMGHVANLGELIQELVDAPRFGCEVIK